jgi:hypothetical protein
MSSNLSSQVSYTRPIAAPDAASTSAVLVSVQGAAQLVDELIVILQIENRQLEGKLIAVNTILNAYSRVINYQTQLLSDMEDLLMRHNIPLPSFLSCTAPATPPPSPI